MTVVACAELVAAKGESITVDELVSEITPHARSTVPDEVKKELLTRIRGFLAQQGAPRRVRKRV